MGPGALSDLLSDLPKKEDENLIVGYESSDDAAVYKISEDKAIIQTLDFFTTMINDPYLFGQIAATNALSDVYAMGGEVISALNIVAFPEKMNMEILHQILKGGSEKVHEAGGVLAGGHSIHDETPKYGLSVTGIIHPEKILMNNNCQLGDILIVTKPLGVSIINSAHMLKECSEETFEKCVRQMTTLNKYAADVMREYPVSSCTDITGFGFLGHLVEMLDGKYSAEIYSKDIPMLPEAYKCANNFIITAGGQLNRNYLQDKIDFQVNDFALEEILFDPQTSGGLLISIPEKYGLEMLDKLNKLEIKSSIVGKVVNRQEKDVVVN
ncbi:selenide, water dikinase SelD [Gemella sp. GH3]|uniref:selenide, water dikinase SelD n=1 Tax=unclassified Gemella TaxID=2624949 RepID=UPI00351B1C71